MITRDIAKIWLSQSTSCMGGATPNTNCKEFYWPASCVDNKYLKSDGIKSQEICTTDHEWEM
jgi:hypothetical protein